MTPKRIKYKNQEYRLVESNKMNESQKSSVICVIAGGYDSTDINDVFDECMTLGEFVDYCNSIGATNSTKITIRLKSAGWATLSEDNIRLINK